MFYHFPYIILLIFFIISIFDNIAKNMKKNYMSRVHPHSVHLLSKNK